jgi:hypothetical protein
MIYLKSILAGIAAVLLALILLVLAIVAFVLVTQLGTGSGGIGAVSAGLPPLIVLTLLVLLAFAAGFYWEFRRASRRALMVLVCLLSCSPGVEAQALEVMPFGGYRFGGDFFELVTGRSVDSDGAPAVGIVLDVPLSGGMQVEGLFTRQKAYVSLPTVFVGSPPRSRITVDHWQGGGLQEFSGGHVRPFLTGLLGLTRYADDSGSEYRFTLGAGGGVKLFPLPHLGFRLESRVFATFIDADGRFVACSTGTCLLAINADVVWQTEFSAGVVVRFR